MVLGGATGEQPPSTNFHRQRRPFGPADISGGNNYPSGVEQWHQTGHAPVEASPAPNGHYLDSCTCLVGAGCSGVGAQQNLGWRGRLRCTHYNNDNAAGSIWIRFVRSNAMTLPGAQATGQRPEYPFSYPRVVEPQGTLS